MAIMTGWQEDGTYVPCPACGWEPEPERRPGRAVRAPGMTHHGWCSTVPQLSAKAQRELQEKLDDIRRCQARAWAEARNYVLY